MRGPLDDIGAMSATAIVDLLDLKPHPEGGYFRETFRDPNAVAGRAASTAIYFLLTGERPSRWRRVDAAEGWHFYAGAPPELSIRKKGTAATHLLGANLAAGERPQAIAPAGAWQAARSLGAWTLVGCTVAPGFDFAHFEVIDGEPPAA